MASLWEETAEDAEGYQSVAGYPGGLFVVRIRGSLRANQHTAGVTARLQRGIGASATRARVFFDLEGFTHYESQVRTSYTNAVAKHTEKVDRVYIYASSRLVRMGASVAGLVLPQLQLVARETFDQLLQAELAKTTGT